MTLKKDPNFEKFAWKMTWGIWWILTRAVFQSLIVFTLIGYFCRKCVMFELKNIEDCVVKNDLWFQKWKQEFWTSSLCKVYKSSVHNVLAKGMCFLEKSSPSNFNFLDFQLLAWVVQFPHLIFETRSQFLYKFCIIL